MFEGSGTGVPPEEDPVPPEEPVPPEVPVPPEEPVPPVDVPFPDEPELPQPELPHPLTEPRLSLLQVASAGALATTASAAAAVQIVYFISFIVEFHSQILKIPWK